MTSPDTQRTLATVLDGVRVLPRRLSLATPEVRATAPMLRGVWGAALAELDPAEYRRVFEGGAGHRRTPLYVIRPAAFDPGDAPALDWFLFGAPDQHRPSLLEAWRLAADRGLGRTRRPFEVRQIRLYQADGDLMAEPTSQPRVWTLGDAASLSPAPDSPCRVSFPAPLRILRSGALITRPTLADLTVACLRRLERLAAAEHRDLLAGIRGELICSARLVPSLAWEGQRLDLHRWSGRQRAELKLRGVAGSLVLPEGAGPVTPLLAAAQWLHLGKGTTVGLGQLMVDGLEKGARSSRTARS